MLIIVFAPPCLPHLNFAPLLQFQMYALSTLIWGREGGRRERVAYAKHCRAQVVQDYVRQLTRIDFLLIWEGSRTEAKTDQCEKGRRTIKWCRIMSDNNTLNTCAASTAWIDNNRQRHTEGIPEADRRHIEGISKA